MNGRHPALALARLCALLAVAGGCAGGHAVSLTSPQPASDADDRQARPRAASAWVELADTHAAFKSVVVADPVHAAGSVGKRQPLATEASADDLAESGQTQHVWALSAAALLALGALSLRLKR